MPKSYVFALAAWLMLDAPADDPESVEDLAIELREHLETEYQVLKLKHVEEEDSFVNGIRTFSLQLQVTFDEPEMQDDAPSDEAIDRVRRELETFLESRYSVASLESWTTLSTHTCWRSGTDPSRSRIAMPEETRLL